jgi:hypothetical protein
MVSKAHWISISEAGAALGMSEEALRKRLNRAARIRGSDGVTEIVTDGIRARKIGRSWRVQLSKGWTSTE